MTMMNRVGVLLYNICLFLTLGILFLAFKNFNFENPSETLDYSDTLKTLLFGLTWIYYAFAIALTISSLISRARKKRFMFSLMMVWFWMMIVLNVLFTFLPDILKDEYTTPVWRYSFIFASIAMAFIPAIGLIFYQFPGSIDKKILINDVKKKVIKEKERASSYCPVCKYPSEQEWKYCPKCGAQFSD